MKLGLSVALIAGALMVGCEQKESATPAPVPSATPAAPAAPAGGAAATLAAPATPPLPAVPAVPDASTAATDAATAAGNAAAQAATAATTQAGGAAAAQTSGQAQQLLDQALQYIKENKLDLADKSITQLEGMKSSLPANLQTAVDSARKALTAAKVTGGGGNLSLPSLPK